MSDDMYDWENVSKMSVKIVIGVYVFSTTDDNKPVITCGFLEKDNILMLPSQDLTNERHAAQIAISMFREYVGIDPRTIDIVPFGFFDPIRPPLDDLEMNHRDVLLGYKTKIHPGTPVHPDLRFLQYEELELARPRITRGHYEAYRTGVSG
jgi:hypothetical protein